MTAESTTRPASPRRLAWGISIAVTAAMLATFLLLAAVGAAEVERGVRVLGFLDPALKKIRELGPPFLTWLATQSTVVGWVVTAAAAALALGGVLTGGRRAFPLIPLMAGVCLATWGQVELLLHRLHLGAWLYGCGVACAVLVGVTDPLHRLAGFPRLPLPADRGRRAQPAKPWLPWSWECALLFLLVCVALLTRLYAITELPDGFDLEIIWHILQSRTWDGLLGYLQSGLLTNAPGIIHLLTHAVLFRLFGASLYTVRLSATFWGVAAVPLFYWLVRRLAGVGPAVVATILFMTAPEQLFWSRSENSFFAPVAVVGLITAHLGLWMVERLSFTAVLATAAWMPVCRYFYIPSMILFAYPLMLYAHTLVFVRGAWRKAWYVVPILSAGLALWIFSLSILFAYVNGSGWRFVNPAIVYGAPAWRKQGEYRNASLPELARLQATSVIQNLGALLQGMVETNHFATHWYVRYATGKGSSLNVGLAVAAALGVGYLAGQAYDRRAAALMLWLLLGLLPACLSNEPGARRMAVAFPAIEAIAGVMLAALVRIARARAGRWVAGCAAALLGIAVIGIVCTSLLSHFLISMGAPAWIERARFMKPIFEESDVVLTDVQDLRVRGALLFGSLDRFVESPFCWQYVEVGQWPGAAIHPACDFTDEAYKLLMAPERVAALRAAYHPRRISYVLDRTALGREHVNLLRALYPAARIREHRNPSGESDFAAVSVDMSDVTALHVAELAGGPAHGDEQWRQNDVLANVPHVPSAASDNEHIVVRGGVLLEHDGWYRFGLEPACSPAALKIDSQSCPSSDTQPMLAGVHSFELTLPRAAGCELPLHLLQSDTGRQMAPVPADRFLSPAAAAIAQVQAPPVATYPGYGSASIFAELKGRAVGFGVDARGHLSVLGTELGTWRIRRFDSDGHEEATWRVPIAEDPTAENIAVDGDGTCIVTAGRRVLLYAATGELTGTWENEFPEWVSSLALWHTDGILMAVPARRAIIFEGRDGKIRHVLKTFVGGPGRFSGPMAVSVDAVGHMLVIEDSGQALLFQTSGESWKPEFVRAFHVGFASLPAQPGGSIFDNGRILVSERSTGVPLVYTLEGERMLAATAERDLSTKGFTQVGGFQAAGDRLYVLDHAASRIWMVSADHTSNSQGESLVQ